MFGAGVVVVVVVVVAVFFFWAPAGSYHAHGVLVDYPSGWRVDSGGLDLEPGGEFRARALWLDALIGPIGSDYAVIAALPYAGPVTPDQISTEAIRESFARAGTELSIERTVAAGYPAFALRYEPTGPSAPQVETRLELVYVDDAILFVSCQRGLSDTTGEAACSSIIGSMRIDAPGTIASPSQPFIG